MVEAPLRPNKLHYSKVGGLKLAAKRWGDGSGVPVLAIHGWLDNCASFDVLAAQLSGTDWFSVDCAGHGLSDHRPHLGAYCVWQDVPELLTVVDQLGWQQFHLVGHSRGAMIAFLIAASFPERVLSLSLLEGVAPMVESPQHTVTRLRDSIIKTRIASERRLNFYPSYEKAVLARCKGMFPLVREDAECLAAHGVHTDEQGYHWRYDAKLTAPSEIRFSEEQVSLFAEQLTMPTVLIMAQQGIILHDEFIQQWLSKHSVFEQQVLPGDHHFHMHSQGRAVAQILSARLGLA